MRKVDVFVKGPGSGRETAIRSLQATGLEVGSIQDVTPTPHNGCRPRSVAASDLLYPLGVWIAGGTGPLLRTARTLVLLASNSGCQDWRHFPCLSLSVRR